MKVLCIFLFFICFLIACNNRDNIPDVSGIKLELKVERFEEDLFQIDTNSVSAGVSSVQKKYPSFAPIFFRSVLGLSDSSDKELKEFLRLNRSIYDSAEVKYRNFNPVTRELEKSFRFVKYYFPNYKIPTVITLVGPVDAMARMQNGEYTPNFLGPDFLGISLQFYLGKNFSLYQVQYFRDNVAPLYRSRKFDKEYITADAMRLIVDDIFPDKSTGLSLIEQIIEKGKRWWMLDMLMPETPDSIKTGYTQKQLDWCKENEGNIWNEIVFTARDLYTKDPATIQNYIGESPTTQGMPESSPGNIGPWVGLEIVKKFVEKNPSLKPVEVMTTLARKILDEAKYKPK